jgi:putative transposase
MPDYRRAFVPGGTYFFTLCTHYRRPLFAEPRNLTLLRGAVRAVKKERPFELLAAVILPDHLHWLWSMPEGDADFSWRIGRIKVLFTRALKAEVGLADGVEAVGSAHPPSSRDRHRESDVWQRRFWEHTIRDHDDFNHHLNYIHYNPVKHGLVRCPHEWAASSFSRWVAQDAYEENWCCVCARRNDVKPYPDSFAVGE